MFFLKFRTVNIKYTPHLILKTLARKSRISAYGGVNNQFIPKGSSLINNHLKASLTVAASNYTTLSSTHQTFTRPFIENRSSHDAPFLCCLWFGTVFIYYVPNMTS